jgi:hypothetical protein
MPPVGVDPSIPASERPLAHALDRAATGIGKSFVGTRNTLS